MVLAPPKCLATTTEVASEAGEVPCVAPATEAEVTAGTAGAGGAGGPMVARGEVTEVGEAIEEEGGIVELVVAIEEAAGMWGGAGGS